MQPFAEYIAGQITAAFKKLLSEKHLYQSVELDLSGINTTTAAVEVQKIPRAPLNSGAKTSRPPLDAVIEAGQNYANKKWRPVIGSAREFEAGVGGQRYGPAPIPAMQVSNMVIFEVPSIQTFCSSCKDSWPFNPIGEVANVGEFQDQWFYLGYQCQKCQVLPVWFMIRRDKLKLRLCGRDPIEAIPAPKELPKAYSKYYSDAQIAHQTGQTLAGIFLLRTFIEQFWRSEPAVQAVIKEKSRATGDELGNAYQATLKPAFRDSFPSLSDVYGRLSAAMHEANADPALFEDCRDKILHHFDGRKAFRIDVR